MQSLPESEGKGFNVMNCSIKLRKCFPTLLLYCCNTLEAMDVSTGLADLPLFNHSRIFDLSLQIFDIFGAVSSEM